MRILFLSHYFPPEVNAPANRTFEHCREWVRLGHEVHVVTCVPSHPRGVAFPGYRSGWYRRELVAGIHVHRVWTWLAPNAGVVRRTLNYLSFVPTAVWRALRLGRCDVIVATSPQFFCAVAGWVSAALKRTPWVFELRDLWPESIAAVGAVRHALALRLLERLELCMYRSAGAVVALTNAFIENVVRRGTAREKLHYVPNGVCVGDWADGDGASVRRELGIGVGEVVASYIGTIGMAHGIGTVLEAARCLAAAQPAVRFVLVGEGAERARLEEEARREGLTNVTFTGLVPHDRMRDFMAATDISLVLLRRSDLFLTVLPSKMFESMAAGRPIVLGVGGEARAVLEHSGAGIPVEPECVDELVKAVTRLAADGQLRASLGTVGRAFVAQEFSRPVWAGRMLEVLQAVARRGKLGDDGGGRCGT